MTISLSAIAGWLALVAIAVYPPQSVHLLSYAAPPDSLEKMVAQSEVIIRGVVVAREQLLTKRGDTELPTVRHTVRILEILKAPADLRKGGAILVSQPGGVAVVRGKEIVIDDREHPIPRDNEQLVFFLSHDPFYGTYASKWGPGSFWKIGDDEKVRVPNGVGGVGVSKEATRRTVKISDALAALRAITNRSKNQ
jgi:hypothetical protein